MKDPLGLPVAWAAIVADAVPAPQLEALAAFVAAAERSGAVYPPAALRFRALELTPPDAVWVVILAQDPYHRPGQAHGLAFSVPIGVRTPPSLVNIHKELAADRNLARPDHGNLEHWARQGVLLLNTVLTVAEGRPGSHRGRGWEAVTDAIIAHVAAGPRPVAFLLWGDPAREKRRTIPALADPRHLVVESSHPSPLAARRSFFGSQPFSKVDAFLEAQGEPPVDWST